MAEDAIAGIPRARLQALEAEESVRFSERTTASQALLKRARESQPDAVPMTWMKSLYRHHPVFVERGDGAWFEDVDGNRYLDMNVVDLAGFLGYAPPAITQAIAERAGSGSSFLLPTEDGIRATELLAERTGIPFWQFTGAASAANTEAIRIARAVTGREKIVMFEGKYHGHIDDTLVQEEAGEIVVEGLGLPTDPTKKACIVPFNDLDALAAALAPGDVACLVAEPMLTNCNVVLPDEGFWNAATSLVRDAGALLVIDEAHTHAFGYGGLTTAWGLEPDILTIGKGFGTGFPFAVWGVREPLRDFLEDHLDRDLVGVSQGISLGGTTYGSALALSLARVALEECLTEEAYAANAALGERLGCGLAKIFHARGLEWRAPVVGGRSGWVLEPELPRNSAEAWRSLDGDFANARRIFMANRGIWEAIDSAGPMASFAQTDADVDHYLEMSAVFLDAVL